MTVLDPATPPCRTYLFADPASHSLSPRMHRAAFAHAGLAGDYQAVRVLPADLATAVSGLRRPDVLGANISLPHKEAVVALLDDLTPAARAIGAVNTVIHRDGRLTGDNTDAPGLFDALVEAGAAGVGDRPRDGAVVVLGAGGAARAAVYAALILLERDVYVVNRTHVRAEELAAAWAAPDADHQARARVAADVPWDDVTLVINASSAGLDAPEQTPLDAAYLTRLPLSAVVYDMVYRPAQTRLMREARAAGLRAENGLGMLAQQARLAFQTWTGCDVPVSVFLNALATPQDEAR
ncbi:MULTISPECIES: shikimate dehydrogenase [Deinococcus]|uniref:Shikimate dehydrogenase (NADP(+)) n=1 Tax=Deinococcus rufus TaxID=2136097 RepID=A0ABV7ZD26_9DEIO|nr:shikimate dehydrogenase [Deinococcus sp. AB2017081]WQE93892.1 shikimate dehydrogenase [Deinococcus sp. AB2017081]